MQKDLGLMIGSELKKICRYMKEIEKRIGFFESSCCQKGKVSQMRVWVLKGVLGAFCVIVLMRLFFLQVVMGDQMRNRSDNNRIIERAIPAARGIVTDRNGKSLVINQPVYRQIMDKEGFYLPDMPVVNPDEEIDEKYLVMEAARKYLYGDELAHVTGYVGEANEEEVESGERELGEIVGRMGLEKSLNELINGQDGKELVEVDAQGKLLRHVGQQQPQPGPDLKLNVDFDLQKKAVEVLADKKGVVVVSNPVSGEVLALVSLPSFDPNLFVPNAVSFDSQRVGEILTDEEKPMLNRVIAGVYPPGSVYKVVPAVAGLETQEIEADTEVEDTGVLQVDEYAYRNWYYSQYGRTEGLVNVVEALKRSNDIFFYKVGEWIGPDRLANWSREFGLGKATGIEISGESMGLVPDPVWKERVKGEKWYLGNTYHMAIGQGDLLVTPMQVHQMMGVIASGGKWCKPRLIKELGGDSTDYEIDCTIVEIAQTSLSLVRDGLVAACQTGGTAYPFFDFDLSVYGEEYGEERSVVACKTGTAQFFDPEDRTHAWFSVYAPAVYPEIQVTVLLEAAGEGSREAAPVARELLDWWFERGV